MLQRFDACLAYILLPTQKKPIVDSAPVYAHHKSVKPCESLEREALKCPDFKYLGEEMVRKRRTPPAMHTAQIGAAAHTKLNIAALRSQSHSLILEIQISASFDFSKIKDSNL